MLATGIKTPVGIKIAGPDLKVIQQLGQQLEQIVGKVEGASSVYAERVAGGRYVKVDIDRLKAARYGLNIADVQAVLATAVGGMEVGQTIEGRERYPINLRYPQSYRDSVASLELLPLVTPSGARIALADVARVYISDEAPCCAVKTRASTVGSTSTFAAAISAPSSAEAKAEVDKQLVLPAGYALTWSGQYEYMERAKARLAYVVPLTVAIIVLLLYLAFRRVPGGAAHSHHLAAGGGGRDLDPLAAGLQPLGGGRGGLYRPGRGGGGDRRPDAGLPQPRLG